MEDGAPQLPAHVEAALTVDSPMEGHTVSCPRCRAVWSYRQKANSWARLDLDVVIPMSGPERLMHFEEGLANEQLDAAAAAGDTEFETPSKEER